MRSFKTTNETTLYHWGVITRLKKNIAFYYIILEPLIIIHTGLITKSQPDFIQFFPRWAASKHTCVRKEEVRNT